MFFFATWLQIVSCLIPASLLQYLSSLCERLHNLTSKVNDHSYLPILVLCNGDHQFIKKNIPTVTTWSLSNLINNFFLSAF